MKTHQLSEKQTNIRSVEQRCYKLDQKIASQKFVVSSIESQIDELDSKYDSTLHQIRMAVVPSAFQARLHQMELTRNQRLSLLQAERESEIMKTHQLSEKQTNIRSVEQRCYKLDQKIASQKFVVSSIESQIDELDSKYDSTLHQIRVLKSEMEELEELKKEKENFYTLQKSEMEEFSDQVDFVVVDCEVQVQELRNNINKLKSSFTKHQGNSACLKISEIAAAEVRKSELTASKENLNRSLASNYQIRAQLQKQLHRILLDKTKKDGR